MLARLLDLGPPLSNSENVIRLYVTGSRFAEYVALNYCWGSKKQVIILTQETHSQLKVSGIIVASLPQTIKTQLLLLTG